MVEKVHARKAHSGCDVSLLMREGSWHCEGGVCGVAEHGVGGWSMWGLFGILCTDAVARDVGLGMRKSYSTTFEFFGTRHLPECIVADNTTKEKSGNLNRATFCTNHLLQMPPCHYHGIWYSGLPNPKAPSTCSPQHPLRTRR